MGELKELNLEDLFRRECEEVVEAYVSGRDQGLIKFETEDRKFAYQRGRDRLLKKENSSGYEEACEEDCERFYPAIKDIEYMLSEESTNGKKPFEEKVSDPEKAFSPEYSN